MKLSYSKTLLFALLPVMGTSLYASESLHPEGAEDNDHAYETVTHTNEKKDGYILGDGWKVTGDMRVGYVNYDYSNSPKNPDPTVNKGHMDSKGIYFIPKVSITSPDYNGLSFKITGGAVTDFGINDEIYESRTFAFGDGTSYAILQEAYVKYTTGGHTFLAGNYELSTPMVDADDWYLFANTFQGAYYKNTTIENIMFAGGYIYQMAGVWDGGAANAHRFHSMADQSYVDQRDKDNAGDAGMWAGVFQYKEGSHNLQLWDYYAVDLYNTFFGQYDYSGELGNGSYDAGAQVINFKDVGGNTYTPIDYSIFSLKFDGKFENGIDFSTGAAFYTDGIGVAETLGAWGGYPYMANGMIFHFFEAGTLQSASSYKGQIGYDIMDDLWLGYRLTYYDLDSSNSFTDDAAGNADKPQDRKRRRHIQQNTRRAKKNCKQG